MAGDYMLNNIAVEDAIKRAENNANYVERKQNDIKSAKYFRQLAELLKDYKRLLENETNGS